MPVVPPKATVADPASTATPVVGEAPGEPVIRQVAPVRKPDADAAPA